jgi:hypothetical protein
LVTVPKVEQAEFVEVFQYERQRAYIILKHNGRGQGAERVEAEY